MYQDAPMEDTPAALAAEPVLFGAIPESQVRAFVGKNADYFIRKFRDIEELRQNAKTLSLGEQSGLLALRPGVAFVSLFVGPAYYFLYRRMYINTLAYVVLYTIAAGICANLSISRYALMLVNAALGLYANRIYYLFVHRKTARLATLYHRLAPDKLFDLLMEKGGTSWLAPTLVFGFVLLSGVLTAYNFMPRYMLRTGIDKYQAKHYQAAVRDLSVNLVFQPGNPKALFYRGMAYWQANDKAQACRDLKAAIQNGAREIQAYTYLSKSLMDRMELEEAFDVVARGLSLYPKSGYLLATRAYYWQKKGNFDRAAGDYDMAVKLEDKQAPVFYMRGKFRLETGEASAAVTDFTEALRLNPKYRDVYHFRAAAYEKLGETELASQDRARYQTGK